MTTATNVALTAARNVASTAAANFALTTATNVALTAATNFALIAATNAALTAATNVALMEGIPACKCFWNSEHAYDVGQVHSMYLAYVICMLGVPIKLVQKQGKKLKAYRFVML